MTAPLWTARAVQPAGAGLTVRAESTPDGLRFVFASDNGGAVGLTFDRTEVRQLRAALDVHLDHTPADDDEPADGAAPGQDAGVVTDPHLPVLS